jgi:hypothetical protein
LENVDIFYGHLVYVFTVGIFYDHQVHFCLFGTLFPVWVPCTKKNLATLDASRDIKLVFGVTRTFLQKVTKIDQKSPQNLVWLEQFL